MHKQHLYNNKTGSFISKSRNTHELDQIAKQLDKLARRNLKDGCLEGLLRGYEADIRQESILLALDWYVRSHPKDAQGCPGGEEWNAPRTLAGSMKITKLRFIERLNHLQTGHRPVTEAELGVIKHPTDEIEHEWPEHRAREVVREGIVRALSSGQISHCNAIVARMVLCKGEPASAIAKRLGIHRSAVYQHLRKVTDAIAPLVKDIEVSYHD